MAKRNFMMIGVIAALQAAGISVLIWMLLDAHPDDPSTSTLALIALAVGLVGILGLIAYGLVIKQTLLRPIANLQRGAEIIIETHAAHEIDMPARHQLGNLPGMVQTMGDEINQSRQEITRALRSGAQKADALKSRLEQVIRGLDEGVFVCDSASRILLYNPASIRILDNHPSLGLGRSLFNLLPQAPIQHTLDMIRTQNPDESELTSTDFMCSVIDTEQMLHCRLALLGETGSDGEAKMARGFVLTFDDVTSKQETLKARNQILRKAMEKLRSPLANLRAAAETLEAVTDMTDAERGAFLSVIHSESERLTLEVDDLGQASRSLVGGEWVLSDIYSSDLINSVVRRFSEDDSVHITMTGLPLWLNVDSHAMVTLLSFYIQNIRDLLDVHAFDLEALLGNNTIYLDLSWEGKQVSQTQLTQWQQSSLKDLVGAPTVEDVLNQVGSEIWSQDHPRLKGRALLRVPLPVSSRQWELPEDKVPPRPVSYDFDIEDLETGDTKLLQKKLRELEYVVFDTETTGLHIESGDQVISIAGVRVVNQRILSGETFDQLIHPGRSIPKDSIRFHGITDDMVQDAPPLEKVLPSFRAFVGDAVMVAHNAWFDMPFLRAREIKAGVRFDNPVLDTLVLSVALHGQDVDQSLDGILSRLGIEVYGRHSALGDSLATAELLLKLIDLLEARSIVTLQDAVNAYHTTKY